MKLSRLFVAVTALVFFQSAWQEPAVAAGSNDKVIITDMLDDDIRALLNLLTDPAVRNHIRAIVTSTGNVHLKAAVARKIVAGLGLHIEVYPGTSTNLAANSVTLFAGNYEREGSPLLTDLEIANYGGLAGRNGNGATMLSKIIASEPVGSKLDVLCITAPTDLVKAIQYDPQSAKRALGDLFLMGLYKVTPTGDFISPYNTMADPQSVADFLTLMKEGYFDHIFHVPSDTVQNRSGLPGGYIPETVEGTKIKQRLVAAMRNNPVLFQILNAAGEYALNWRTTAVQQFGTGLSQDQRGQAMDRWVPSTFANPNAAVGFYLADSIPASLTTMSLDELLRMKFDKRRLAAPDIKFDRPFLFTADSEGREILDVHEFDGQALLQKHVGLVEGAKQFAPLPIFNARNNSSDARNVRVLSPGSEASTNSHQKALIMVFKNSPDDWFGLLRILASKKGRAALNAGGIICEGFQTTEMRDSVIGLLDQLGVNTVRVAAGTQYRPEDVQTISNFKGEIAFNELRQNDRAFNALKPSTLSPQAVSVDSLMTSAKSWAQANHSSIDAIVLGEGVDLFDRIAKDPSFVDYLNDVFMMGGGRVQNDKIAPSRNWIRNPKMTLDYLKYLGQRGKKIFVFSSNEFGGSMVSNANGDLGNGAVAFNTLQTSAENVPALKGVFEHWKNWSRIFDWVISQKGQGQFDAGKPVDIVTISPLGLRIADEWLLGPDFGNHREDIQQTEVALTLGEDGIAKVATLGSGIFWANQPRGQSVVGLAGRFSHSISQIQQSALALKFDADVRDHSIFSAEAKASYRDLKQSVSPTANQCRDLFVK